jgi:hypothetical protein
MITINLVMPTDVTVKQNRMGILHKLLHKATIQGIIHKKRHQVSAEDESILDLNTKKTYRLSYEDATYVTKFELVEDT